jgi:hypothetical protein
METLSSSLTFFYKFIFTTVWSTGFGLGTVALFFSDKPEAQHMRGPFALAWFLGSAFLWWGCVRLKRVQLDRATLIISNYRDEIVVPVSDIAEVKQNRLINTRPITITFAKENRFGRSITFIPTWSFRGLTFREDEVVERLRRMSKGG